jgi:hypothetical protein
VASSAATSLASSSSSSVSASAVSLRISASARASVRAASAASRSLLARSRAASASRVAASACAQTRDGRFDVGIGLGEQHLELQEPHVRHVERQRRLLDLGLQPLGLGSGLGGVLERAGPVGQRGLAVLLGLLELGLDEVEVRARSVEVGSQQRQLRLRRVDVGHQRVAVGLRLVALATGSVTLGQRHGSFGLRLIDDRLCLGQLDLERLEIAAYVTQLRLQHPLLGA